VLFCVEWAGSAAETALVCPFSRTAKCALLRRARGNNMQQGASRLQWLQLHPAQPREGHPKGCPFCVAW
jgi:hypothetical protein